MGGKEFRYSCVYLWKEFCLLKIISYRHDSLGQVLEVIIENLFKVGILGLKCRKRGGGRGEVGGGGTKVVEYEIMYSISDLVFLFCLQ